MFHNVVSLPRPISRPVDAEDLAGWPASGASTGHEMVREAVKTIQERYGIPILLDAERMEEEGISSDMPVSLTLHGISLGSLLNVLLRDLDMQYVVADEVLYITTTYIVCDRLTTRIYMVEDLAAPLKDDPGNCSR